MGASFEMWEEMVMPRRLASLMGWSGFFRSRVTRSRLPCAAYLGAAHDGANDHLVGLRQVSVPRDVYADVRLWQAEV